MRNLWMLVLVFSAQAVFGQQLDKYWVFFTDKDGVTFDPYSYFDPKAIENRILNEIPLDDITNYPVRTDYVAALTSSVEEVKMTTRWFNGAVCMATEDQINQVRQFQFVKKVEKVFTAENMVLAEYNETDYKVDLSDSYKELLDRQTDIMGGQLMAEKGFNGEGVRVAIFDAGFPTVDTNPCFDHMRKNGKIKATYDFVKKKEFVYSYSSHGTFVLSNVGGMIEGRKMGLATEAEFILARTEMGMREPFAEEENWLAAAEWADKNGATVINSSLGYTHHRYFYNDMDGTSYVAKAANMAARKGILVVNAAGNEGSGDWKFIGTPADADSVLSIGGIDPKTDTKVGFSSFGPTYDKRMKPNVSAYGWAIGAGEKGIKKSAGTSFASPLVCGFVACARQAFPEMKTMDLFHKIEESGSLYPYFDYGHGYGIPQAERLFGEENAVDVSYEIIQEDGVYYASLGEDYGCGGVIYMHIADPNNVLREWSVKTVEASKIKMFSTSAAKKGDTVRVCYNGKIVTLTVK